MPFGNQNPSTPASPAMTPAQIEAQQYDVSSLRSLTWHEPSKTRDIKTYTAAYASANPNAWTTKETKAAALKGYVNNHISSPDFQKLDYHNKVFSLQLLYQKWVQPALKDQGINPPTFEEWAAGVIGTGAKQDTRPKATLTGIAKASASESLGHDVDLAANVIKSLFGNQQKLIQSSGFDKLSPTQRHNIVLNQESAVRGSRYLHSVAGKMQKVSDDYLAQNNVADTKGTWLANMAGQAVGAVPMFALTEAAGGVALGAGGIGEAGGLTERLFTLAERANMGGKGSQIALRAYSDALQQFVISKGQGESTEKASSDAAVMAILGGTLGTIFHGAHVAGDKGAKALIAKTIKLGAAKTGVAGEGLINAVEDTATKETETAEAKATSEKSFADKIKEKAKEQVEDKTREYIRDQSGLGDRPIAEVSAAALAKVSIPRSSAERLYSLVRDDDPHFIQAKQAEIAAREQWARHFFPEKAEQESKVWNNLSKQNRARIISIMSQFQKSGARLMPLAQPEVQMAHNVQYVDELFKSDPARANRLAMLYADEAKGDPQRLKELVARAITKAQASDVAGQIGVNQPQVNLENAFADDAYEYEPIEGESASLGSGYKVSYMANYKPALATLLSRDTKTDKFLSGTVKYLEKNSNTDSGHLYYEHPKMHLLSLAYNSEAPAAVKAKAKRILVSEFSTDATRQRYEAQWLKFHVERLRDTGHLNGGNNPGRIFRSTKLLIPRYGTKYQNMLTPEMAQSYTQEMAKTIAKQDPKLAASLAKFYKAMTKYTVASQKPETAMSRLKRLRNIHSEVTEIK